MSAIPRFGNVERIHGIWHRLLDRNRSGQGLHPGCEERLELQGDLFIFSNAPCVKSVVVAVDGKDLLLVTIL